MTKLSRSAVFEKVLTAREKANLEGTLFLSWELEGLDLSGADLRNTRFERATIADCNLSGVDLRGATFHLCELRNVVFTGVVLGDNRFDGTTFVEIDGLTAEDRALIEGHGGSFQQQHASLR